MVFRLLWTAYDAVKERRQAPNLFYCIKVEMRYHFCSVKFEDCHAVAADTVIVVFRSPFPSMRPVILRNSNQAFPSISPVDGMSFRYSTLLLCSENSRRAYAQVCITPGFLTTHFLNCTHPLRKLTVPVWCSSN